MLSRGRTPRYLVPFHPKHVPHFFTDILVIGSGLAGLRTALAARRDLSVLVVTKDGLSLSSSAMAQGGIAGVLSPDDRLEDHVDDTMAAGGSLCDRGVVEQVIRESAERIGELIAWGTDFDRSGVRLALGREGGHGRNRIAHARGDATGKEIMRVVANRAIQAPNVALWQDTFVLDLLSHEGACRGALVWNPRHGKTLVWAKQTVLATGGAGQLYRETTNPEVATGDGLALAYRVGAELRDMEFMQFHPTMLYIAGSSRHLITEAIRGEGAHLVDRNGHRFMPDYDDRAELAPRDVVSHAIVTQMEKTKYPNVYLELSHLDPRLVAERFPALVALCHDFDLDVTKDRIPVRPGAHYMVGGVTVDSEGRTTVPSLWAVGEVASTGLHGANRLASNSLLEALVFGVHAGVEASAKAGELIDDFRAVRLENQPLEPGSEPLDLADIRNSLKSLMWRNVGVRRDRDGLAEAAETLDHWCRYVLDRQFSDPSGWELQNMLCVARLMTRSALVREESRGCHARTDFPGQDDERWNRHSYCRRDEER
ncbi:MAG: L-aspartate oxidase [Pirellulales bacterium]|nr:L-aspartate oxidase [Pirellulales bacterium]